MEKADKCVEKMDLSQCWTDWRSTLKQSIESSRTYYQDETIQVLVSKLNDFLNNKVCASSQCEEVMGAMWDAATVEERRTVANLFLKIANKL
jgi:hypothetical protein